VPAERAGRRRLQRHCRPIERWDTATTTWKAVRYMVRLRPGDGGLYAAWTAMGSGKWLVGAPRSSSACLADVLFNALLSYGTPSPWTPFNRMLNKLPGMAPLGVLVGGGASGAAHAVVASLQAGKFIPRGGPDGPFPGLDAIRLVTEAAAHLDGRLPQTEKDTFQVRALRILQYAAGVLSIRILRKAGSPDLAVLMEQSGGVWGGVDVPAGYALLDGSVLSVHLAYALRYFVTRVFTHDFVAGGADKIDLNLGGYMWIQVFVRAFHNKQVCLLMIIIRLLLTGTALLHPHLAKLYVRINWRGFAEVCLGPTCEHQKQKHLYKACLDAGTGGGSLCVHRKQKQKCVDCLEAGTGGGSLYVHRKQKHLCKACFDAGTGGGSLCVHRKQKQQCMDCWLQAKEGQGAHPSGLCVAHGSPKTRCTKGCRTLAA
jgi:hypothetical protein